MVLVNLLFIYSIIAGGLFNFVTGVTDCKEIEVSGRPLETRVENAEVVFRGIASAKGTDNDVEMALASIYKGATALAKVSAFGGTPFNTTDRRVLVVESGCWLGTNRSKSTDASLHQFVVFGRIIANGASAIVTPSDAAVPWTSAVDTAIWSAVGWGSWTEWSGCTASCAGGQEMKKRSCDNGSCKGPEIMTRTCNTFKCEDAVSLVSRSTQRLFHADWTRWSKISGRPAAFSLTPDSYIWLASKQVFSAPFPSQFTLFTSLRLRPESGGLGQGTLFSLVSRSRRDAYLSLELSGLGVRLVHASPQANLQAVVTLNLDVPLHDLRWHRIAISVNDDSSVMSYVDCRWQRSDVLRRGQLSTPEDADLIIGYLFSGDLEQLTILPKSGLAMEQCSDVELPSKFVNLSTVNNILNKKVN